MRRIGADPAHCPRCITGVRRQSRGIARERHDVSDGGLLVAAAEMCIGSGRGLDLKADAAETLFLEPPGQYLVEFEHGKSGELQDLARRFGLNLQTLGVVSDNPRLRLSVATGVVEWTVEAMTSAWRGTLDW